MNNSQIEQYRRDGYVVVRAETIYIAPMAEMWKRMPAEEYRHSARMTGLQPAAFRCFTDPDIVEAARLLGILQPVFLTQPAIHVMGVDEAWEGVKAHQDWSALQTGLNTVVCWVPLTEVGIDNYPVEFVPGSHLRGLLPAKPGAHYSEVDTTGMEFVPVPVKLGEVIFFSAFTVHRTRTLGNGVRVAVSHRFEDASDPWYNDHRYSAQRRVIDREIKWTPSVDQVRKIFE